MKRTTFLALGVALLVLGLPLTVRALLLMYDTTTTTYVWMLREFCVGACIVGWGIAMFVPPAWRRLALGSMALGTIGIATGFVLLSQGMPG